MVTIRQDKSCLPGLRFWNRYYYYSVSWHHALLNAVCLVVDSSISQRDTDILERVQWNANMTAKGLKQLASWNIERSLSLKMSSLGGYLTVVFNYLVDGYVENGWKKSLFSWKCTVKRAESSYSQVTEREIPNRRKITVTRSVVQHWIWLPKKAVESLSLEILNIPVHKAQSCSDCVVSPAELEAYDALQKSLPRKSLNSI